MSRVGTARKSVPVIPGLPVLFVLIVPIVLHAGARSSPHRLSWEPPRGGEMARQIALLRGINLGSSKRVSMSDLRGLMEGLGYGDVRTHLQSGNVIFTTAERPDAAAQRIESGLLSG